MSPLPPLVPERTPLLDMPYIMPSQAQKHVTHNEALRALDSLVHLAVTAGGVNEPPEVIEDAERFIVGPEPTGAWSMARADQIAAMEDGAWTFRTPRIGWRAYVQNSGSSIVFDGATWIEEQSGTERTNRLGVNTDADDTNRLAVASAATLLTHDGADHRLVINRAGETNTASLVFQTAWSGRAEFGLAGDGDWRVKVSEDGANWRDALIAGARTGAVSFPHGTHPEQWIAPPPPTDAPADEVIGFPNLATTAFDRTNVTCTPNRIYFSPFLVDRPTLMTGLHVAQHAASTTAGAVLRGGVCRLGEASGTGWRIGERITDCGTQPADSNGHKVFGLAQPIELEPGWYATVFGTDGTGAAVRAIRSMTPGLTHFVPQSSGASTDIRFGGASIYVQLANRGDVIANGIPATWDQDAIMIRSSRYNALHLALPRWRRW